MQGEETLFDFAVPDDLLREAVHKRNQEETVADIKLMPGTGDGKLPSLAGIFRRHGFLPLFAMTAAALVPSAFGTGIGIITHTLEHSLHTHLAGIVVVAQVGTIAGYVWAVPLSVWADRGSRKIVAACALLLFAVFAIALAFAPNIWDFGFLFIGVAIGGAVPTTVHNSYLCDAYPTEARGRVFAIHRLFTPISNTLGVFIFSSIVVATHDWRYGAIFVGLAIPIGIALFFLKEPAKGSIEEHHILRASGMDTATQREKAPRVLLGATVTRMLRIRSIYFELIAILIIGFSQGPGNAFTSTFIFHKFNLNVAGRSDVFIITLAAGFLGLPIAYMFGDRFFRRAPQRPLIVSGIAIMAYGVLYFASLFVPSLWEYVTLQALANVCVLPLAICIFLTLAATAPPEMRTVSFAMFGICALFGGLIGGISLLLVADHNGGPSNAQQVHGFVVALSLVGPVCVIGGLLLIVGSRFVLRDITLVVEDVLERFAEAKRREAGGTIPALQIHDLDFFYGPNQVLFGVNFEVGKGEVVALLGTNGAGKSTLLRAIAGLEHPHRGVIRLDGAAVTYLESEQIVSEGVSFLLGGKMTFPGLTVRDNLRIGEQTIRKDRARVAQAHKEALETFPELVKLLDQPAGTLSGGEQQMLAVARVMLTKPKILMIDELSLGLAPKTVDRLMEIVRRVNAEGTTVIIVEQSVNRAASLANKCIFLERGQVRFDGLTKDLLERHDLLRPVFLAAAGSGIG